MPILNVQVNQVGQAGVFPAIIYILTNDTVDEVTATGYLDTLTERFGISLSNADMALVTTATSPNAAYNVNWFSVSYSDGKWSLTNTSFGTVTSLTGTQHQVLVNGTYGTPETGVVTLTLPQSLDTTSLPTFAALTLSTSDLTVAEGNIFVTVGDITLSDGDVNITDGNVNITIGNVNIANGSVFAGSSGHAGTLTSFPGTAANGSLIIAGVNAGADNTTTISNGTMGQSTIYTMGDIGASTGGLVVATSAIRMKSVAGASVAGGAAAQTISDAFCTSVSNVVGNWNTQANAVTVEKIVPGNGSFVVTSSGDPGASTFNYIITK